MKDFKKSVLVFQVVSALIWAILIVLCSSVLEGNSRHDFVFYAVIVASGFQISLNGFLVNKLKKVVDLK